MIKKTPQRPLVSVIIVNWNGLHWLKMCLPSLSEVTYTPVEIIIVDNASTDGSVAWVKKTYPHAKIAINSENLGFAEANNVGYRMAGGEYILLLNNDTVVERDFITRLVRRINESPDIAGVQGKMLLMDDHTRLDAAGAYLTPTGFLLHWGFGQKDSRKYDDTEDIYTTKGACMMIRKTVLENVKMHDSIFDPSYFAYFEESDLCHRILLTGKRLVYAPSSVIYHKMGGTSTGMNNAFIQYHSFKNRIRTYIKNLSFPQLVRILPVHLFMCFGFALGSLVKGKIALAFAIVRAVWWNVVRLPSTLSDRAYIQGTIRKVPDEAYLRRVMRYPPIGYYLLLSQGKSSAEYQ